MNRLRRYNKTEFIESIAPNSNFAKERTNTTSLSQHIRILYSFIIYYLCPRTGSHTYFNKLDWYILWHLLIKQKLNLAYLIFKGIIKNTTVRSLPYGMFLTLVFKKLKINLKNKSYRAQILVIKETYTRKVEKRKSDKKGSIGKN